MKTRKKWWQRRLSCTQGTTRVMEQQWRSMSLRVFGTRWTTHEGAKKYLCMWGGTKQKVFAGCILLNKSVSDVSNKDERLRFLI